MFKTRFFFIKLRHLVFVCVCGGGGTTSHGYPFLRATTTPRASRARASSASRLAAR